AITFPEFEKIKKYLTNLVNVPLAEGITPLKKLVEKESSVELINLFLQQGAISEGIDFTKYCETSNVEMAIVQNCSHLVKLLIGRRLLSPPQLPQLIACAGNNAQIEILDELIRFHIQQPLTYHILETYLSTSISAERQRCLEILNQVFEHNKEAINESYKNSSLLIQAVLVKETILVDFLLERGADPNFKGIEDETALILACIHQQIKILRSLLTKGADPNLKRHDGISPLYMAMVKNDLEAFEMLLKNNADPNLKSYAGQSPLYVAMKKNDLKAFKMLLKNGADPNLEIVDEEGVIRLLDYVIAANNYPQIELLLKYGVDIEYHSDFLAKHLSTKTLNKLNKGVLDKNWLSPLGISFSNYLRWYTKDASNTALKITKLFLKTYARREIFIDENLLNEFIETAIELEDNELESLFTSFQKDQDSLCRKHNLMQVDQISTSPISNIGQATLSQLPPTTESVAIPATIEVNKEGDNVNNNNISAVSLFPPSNIQKDKKSSFAYLKSLGFTKEEIINMCKESVEKNKKNTAKTAKYSTSTFWTRYHLPESLSWSNVNFNKESLRSMSLGTNIFFYLELKALRQQGCDEETLSHFKQVRVRMDGAHVEKLEGDYSLNIIINKNEPSLRVKATHELRIFSSEARVLLFSIAADGENNKQYKLYIGGKFLANGLHELKDEKALKQSRKAIQITLSPPENEAIVPGCSAKTFSC
ncbi:MAG: ankyrin repeat domain-containing protein, partial [Gammaproteobacteria bacterium]